MTRKVFCRKYKEELEGLMQPPYPGKRGQDIYDNVSQKAWLAWMQHQTMLINERKLNLMDLSDRTYLNEQMDRFFSGEAVDDIEGYVPEKDA